MTTKASSETDVAWATFLREINLGSDHTRVGAIAATGTMRIVLTELRGVPCLMAQDESMRGPAYIPCSNVASMGLKP
jgi:hypothetical protein